MKIVFVASEMVPYAKTGGLADVVGTLSAEMRLLGHEVAVFLPRYRCVDLNRLPCETVLDKFEVEIGSEKETGQVLRHDAQNGVPVYFIEKKEYFDRDELYGTLMGDYPDNDRRFIFFQKAVLKAISVLKMKPQIIHCHDWQAGLIPVYVKTLHSHDSQFQKLKTIYTIHNLAYQGTFPPDSLPLTGLGWEHFTYQRLEFFGKVNFLKGGIVDADIVTTVSERYSKEIQTKEFGCGLEGALVQQSAKLHGIVNGIDCQEWDPAHDQKITAVYDQEHLAGKAKNKAALQHENGLRIDPNVPLLGMIARLTDQKGVDILIQALEPILNLGTQFVLLGTGEEKYHKLLREIARKHRQECAVHILFDSDMAKRIYAGCDIFLMPSYYEPCGLGQMIALRYGTIPVVRETGGLADTIENYSEKTGKGNGFVFKDYRSSALLDAVERAVHVYASAERWEALVTRAMACDFSWAASAKQYVELYKAAEKRPIEGVNKMRNNS